MHYPDLTKHASAGTNYCAQVLLSARIIERRCRARSRAEFVAKLGVVLEEAYETAFWLDLMKEADVFPEEKLQDIVRESRELASIFVASVRTAKGFTSSI